MSSEDYVVKSEPVELDSPEVEEDVTEVSDVLHEGIAYEEALTEAAYIDPSLLDTNVHGSQIMPVSSDFQDVSLSCVRLHHMKVLLCHRCMYYDELLKNFVIKKYDNDLH